jgi:SSS family solute:Na+ symporter
LAVKFIPAQTKFWGNPTIPAVAVGIIAQVVISLLTLPASRSFDEVALAMSRERQNIEGASPH